MGWLGETGVTFGGSSGNVDVLNTGLRTQNIFKTELSEFMMIGRFVYGEVNSRPVANRGEGHLRYAESISESSQWEIFTQAEFNEFQSLDLRLLAGGGLRWKLYKDDERSLYLGAGAFYEDEIVIGDKDQNNFRGNIYFTFRQVVNSFAEVVTVMYYQPNFDKLSDYRVRINTGFEFKLAEDLSWTNEVRFMRDTAPPANIQKNDLFFAVALNYKY